MIHLSNMLAEEPPSIAGPRRTRTVPCGAGHFEDRATRAMSTINDVRATEKRLQEILDAIKRSQTRDLALLSAKLLELSDDYARLVGELTFSSLIKI